MTVAYDDYVKYVQPDVPGCPYESVVEAINGAVIELCAKSQIWRATLTPNINIVQGTDTYTLTPPTDTRVIIPVYVEYDVVTIKKKLLPATEEEMDFLDPQWRIADESSPFRYLMLGPTQIQLNRKPDQAITAGLLVRAALKPTPTATGADDIVFNDWYEIVVHGAKGRLMSQTTKPWGEGREDETMYHLNKFTSGVVEARARQTMGHTKKPATVQLRQWV